MSDTGETTSQRLRRNVIAGTIAAVFVAGAAVGVPVAVNASNTAHAQEIAQTDAANGATAVTRADGARDVLLVGSATQAGVIAQQEADAAAAAAAQAAAAQAAADAAAAQAAQQQQAQAQSAPADSGSGGGDYVGSSAGSSGAASGTPVPMKTDTDPNSGTYGQQVIAEDPGLFCAAHSASTINGVPTCD